MIGRVIPEGLYIQQYDVASIIRINDKVVSSRVVKAKPWIGRLKELATNQSAWAIVKILFLSVINIYKLLLITI